jgi:hypothetical protein
MNGVVGRGYDGQRCAASPTRPRDDGRTQIHREVMNERANPTPSEARPQRNKGFTRLWLSCRRRGSWSCQREAHPS